MFPIPTHWNAESEEEHTSPWEIFRLCSEELPREQKRLGKRSRAKSWAFLWALEKGKELAGKPCAYKSMCICIPPLEAGGLNGLKMHNSHLCMPRDRLRLKDCALPQRDFYIGTMHARGRSFEFRQGGCHLLASHSQTKAPLPHSDSIYSHS